MKREIHINFNKHFIKGNRLSIYIYWHGYNFRFRGESYWNWLMMKLQNSKINTKNEKTK